MSDTVSVIIPAYNAEAYVARAIESVLAQTHPAHEIFVIDDGSRDATAAVAGRFGPPVVVLRKPNGGPASARNHGARLATGEWLALLDADDWWFPGKLAAQLACDTSPRIGLIHSLIDQERNAVPDRLDFAALWRRNWIGNSSVLIRRSAFLALGGFDEARELISVEDYNLWLRLAAADWQVVTCRQALVHYTAGIGISSNAERFLRASLYNVAALERRLGLPARQAQRKRADIRATFGRKALYERRLDTARSLLRQALLTAPSPRHAYYLLYLLAALLPRPVLDLKRSARRLRRPATETDAAAPTAAPLPRASVTDTRVHTPVPPAALDRPVLLVIADAEESFDWGRPFDRNATDVTAMRSLARAHRVFERYGVVPTYMVDFPVASQEAGRAPLRELLQSLVCDVGTQLHPWVSPPHDEPVTDRNSFPGNLPPALEREKLRRLTDEIEAAFDRRPRIYRAGRYGAGPHTGEILRELGYLADSSVMPGWNFAPFGGPDYRARSAAPCWLDAACGLLELPIAAATVGRAADLSPPFAPALFRRAGEFAALRFPLARLGLLERIKLTPEGITVAEAQRLLRHMHAAGQRVFVLTYHTPSLEPGNTPYVRSNADLQRFLGWLDEVLDFFRSELGGRFATWDAVRARMLAVEAVPA